MYCARLYCSHCHQIWSQCPSRARNTWIILPTFLHSQMFQSKEHSQSTTTLSLPETASGSSSTVAPCSPPYCVEQRDRTNIRTNASAPSETFTGQRIDDNSTPPCRATQQVTKAANPCHRCVDCAVSSQQGQHLDNHETSSCTLAQKCQIPMTLSPQ